tara:strand:- start:143 stop:892 length:750 start_codon:yes stop_codon:yes gene_type:complete
LKHIVSLSGGTASAVAANRVMQRKGKDNVILWFADTSWEDEDLYRFLIDLENFWDKEIVRYKDGRNPLQVGEDVKFILNSRIRACSRILKQEAFRKYLKKLEKPVTIHLGMDWTEEHRMAAPKNNYEQFEGVKVSFPLMWKPWYKSKYSKIVEKWGIEIPRLYKMGFPHNNCGGRCIAQGKREWKRLGHYFPERYNEVMNWEEKMREELGTAKGKTILKDITLRDLKKVKVKNIPNFTAEDSYGCFCAY